MKKLARLSYQQIEFVKVGFKKLGFQTIEIKKEKLCLNGKKIDLIGYSSFPVYTNEVLELMTTEELYDVAIMWGYNPQVHRATNFETALNNLGEKTFRSKLHAYIYTRDQNHPYRVHAKLQNGEEISITNMLDMASALRGFVPDSMINRSIVSKVLA